MRYGKRHVERDGTGRDIERERERERESTDMRCRETCGERRDRTRHENNVYTLYIKRREWESERRERQRETDRERERERRTQT